MSETILAAATAEQRAILAPHVERLEWASREAAEARETILAAARAFWPGLMAEGVKFDTARGVLWTPTQESDNGAA